MGENNSMALWQWQELLLACGIDVAANGPDVSGISIDSRSLEPGDLFVALSGNPGPRFSTSSVVARDGHEFVQKAKSAGAAGILVSRDTSSSLPEIRMENTLDGLWQIGAAARERMQGKVVGITGSSGKTTARSWLESILSKEAQTHASTGSFNNHWGVPLSLARMPRNAEYGVFEIGMSNPGEIAPLSELVRPSVALLLNVLPAHLQSFDDLDAVRREKLSITSGLSDEGILVLHEGINLDGIYQGRVVTFGFSKSATVSAELSSAVSQTQVQVTIDGKNYAFHLAVGGVHRVLTALGCLGTAYALGADLEQACEVIASLETPAGRGNLLELSGLSIIDDSYNANPVSMQYALDALRQRRGGRKIAVLGEMLELGADSGRYHESILDSCKELDGVITVGEGFANISPGDNFWGHYDASVDIDLAELAELLEEGDIILVKGSNKVFWVNNFITTIVEALS
ncbi:MAG: UDP-N-acetylmuramoylalanyl-D-glutamyl-2, 6-diaminopimelate--D-alanyl-D-alanine ligase [Gammaproteobacteria bacterium]|nr:UDP-N-acetylmuramoylalanyl-D-glutamyl-2, 6-diaminopimelate--D-alanyl-D-alanine ligase [Gammaproteobacteria bacterium]